MRRAHLPLIAAGLAAFVVTLIVVLPARLLTPLLPANITAGPLEGSLWSGHTATVAFNGRYVGALRWRARPLQLFRGRLALDIEVRRADGEARGRLGMGIGRRVEAQDLVVSLPVAGLPPGIAPSGWTGSIHANLAELAIRPGTAPQIAGTIELRNLQAPAPDGTTIGSYRLVFDQASRKGDKLVGNLQDIEGPMEVAGTLSLGADRSYVVDGMVAPRAGASQAVTGTLRFLGAPDAQGRRPFSLAGTY